MYEYIYILYTFDLYIFIICFRPCCELTRLGVDYVAPQGHLHKTAENCIGMTVMTNNPVS